MLKVLRQRNFALLWFGQLISAVGDWVLMIALPFYVYEQTGSALATGVMVTVQILPSILFSSLAGVFVDRWNRKWTMVMADFLRAFVLLFLLAAHVPNWLWVIYPVAFLRSAISQFFNPAKSAIIPILVGKQNLMAANTLNSFGDHLVSLVGPALGGVALVWLGLTGVVFLDVVSFLLSGLMILFIVLPSDPGRTQVKTVEAIVWTAVWREWLAGLRLIKRERLIVALFTIVGVTMLGQGIINVLWIVFVKEILGGSALEYGWVQVAVASGGLIGTFIIGRTGQMLSSGRLIGLSGMTIGLLLLATFNLPSLPIILALQFLVGIPAVGFFVTIRTLLQTSAADHYLGRIFGTYNTTNALLIFVGQGLASALGDRLGLVSMLNLSGGLYFLGGVVALVILSSLTGVRIVSLEGEKMNRF